MWWRETRVEDVRWSVLEKRKMRTKMVDIMFQFPSLKLLKVEPLPLSIGFSRLGRGKINANMSAGVREVECRDFLRVMLEKEMGLCGI